MRINFSDIDIARRTSITRKYNPNINFGRAIGESITPKFAINLASKNDLILDFGAGKHPYYVMKYRDDDYNIFGWDLPETMKIWSIEYSNNEILPINGLNNQFDLVYASNVLNVAPNEDFLRKMTLDNIKKALKLNGVFVGNYPREPRKNIKLKSNELYEILKEYFREVSYDSKRLVFICKD